MELIIGPCLHDEASIKISKVRGSESFPVGEHREVLEEWHAGESMELLCSFLQTLTYTLFPSGCSSVSFIISFNKLVNINVSLSSMSYSSKFTEPKEGSHWNLWPTACWSEAQVTSWTCKCYLKWGNGGQSCRTELLACRILHSLQIDSIRS